MQSMLGTRIKTRTTQTAKLGPELKLKLELFEK